MNVCALVIVLPPCVPGILTESADGVMRYRKTSKMEDQIHGLEDSFNQAMDDAKEMTKKIQSIPSSKYLDLTI